MGGEEERQEEVEGIKNDDSTLRRVKNPPDNFHDCDIKKKLNGFIKTVSLLRLRIPATDRNTKDN